MRRVRKGREGKGSDDNNNLRTYNPHAHGPYAFNTPSTISFTQMGWLNKRNRSGFRNWKKRWFVLKGAELSWFGSPDEVFSGTTWGVPHGTINLKNNVLIKGKNLRFQILDCDNIDKTNDDRLHNREVAALNDADLEEWLAALEDHIEETNR